VLPDGRLVTPVGTEIQVELQPLNEVLSHDGRRLYVSSEGINDDPATTNYGDGSHKRFITVIDTQANQVIAKIRDDSLHYGMAEALDGTKLYVSEGATDSIGVIDRIPGSGGAPDRFGLEGRHIPLDPAEQQRHVYPWGLAMSRDGSVLYVVGFSSDTLYAVDIRPSGSAPRVVATAPTGQYPYTVVVSSDGRRLYVSNWGQYNPGVAEYSTSNVNHQLNSPIVPPPATIGGYNTTQSSSVWSYDVGPSGPQPAAETPIGHELNGTSVDGGSQPSALALSPDGRTLAVTSSNDDLVELLNTTATQPATETPGAAGDVASGPAALVQHPAATIDLRVMGTTPTGAEPDALAWSPDASVLFVAEAGRNSVAVVDPTKVGAASPASPGLTDPTTAPGQNRGAVIGRIPTAWYPDGLAVSGAGDHLWILNDNGLGSGANTDLGPDGKPILATYQDPTNPHTGGSTDLAYIPNTIHGLVEGVDLPAACGGLSSLSHSSDLDNGLVQSAPAADGAPPSTLAGTGYVVPTGYGQKTSDGVQKIKHVFLIIKENRSFDQIFGDVPGNERDARFTDFGRTVTPNQHYLAQQFASGDNYYVNSETSRDGHFAVDTGQVTEFLQKTVPSSYAGKIPFDAMDTNPENIPQAGFIWDNASRAGVRSRIYGEGTYIIGVSPSTLGAVGTGAPALNPQGALVPGLNDANVTFDSLYPTQAQLPGVSKTPLYMFNDQDRATEFARDFSNELGPVAKQLGAGGGAAATALADPLVPALNVMILFDDHTAGDIGNAPFPRDYVAENDYGLGRVVNTIASSPIWSDSAVFVAEDDTQGGQDHVDAHRSFGLVMSPWTKRPGTGPGYVSHVHTSFSSITKTIDLLLGIPPSSLQEMVATPLADDFVTGPGPDVPKLDVPVVQPETYGGSAFGFKDAGKPTATPSAAAAGTNYTVANAPNATLRRAAQLALLVHPGIDAGGALAGYDLALEQQGLRQLGDPSAQVSDVVEHRLEAGSPRPVELARGGVVRAAAAPTAGAACLAAARSSGGGGTGRAPGLPATGTAGPWPLVGALALVAAMLGRRRARAVRFSQR